MVQTMRFLGFASFLMAHIFIAPAQAQSITDVAIPKTGICPHEDIKKNLAGLYNEKRGFGFSFFKEDDFKAETTSRNDGEPVDKQPALLERVQLLGRNVDKKTVLISYAGSRGDANKEQFCGWVAYDALVKSLSNPTAKYRSFTDTGFDLNEARAADADGWGPRPMTMEQVLPDDKDAKGNTLNAKALIQSINTDAKWGDIPETPKSSEKDKDVPVAKIYDKPGGKVIGGQKMFNVFNILETKGEGVDRYFLLSLDKKNALGWMQEKDQLIWPSRMAIHWTGKGKGLIYENYRDASLKQNKFYEEPDGVLELLPKKHNVPRYPILGPKGAAGKTIPDIYNIAFIGQNTSQDNAQRDVIAGLNKLKNVDVLFVLDATESMEFLFSDVVRSVERFIEEKLSDESVRVGVITYGDYLSSSGGAIQLDTRIEMTRLQRGDSRIKNLLKTITYTDKQIDKPEAMFAALKQSVEKISWRDTPARFVIHIGDHGNRQDGLASKTITNDATTRDVEAAFKDKKIALYIPIAVRGDYNQPYNEAFIAQVSGLLTRINVDNKGSRIGRDLQITYDAGSGRETGDRVDSIVRALKVGYEAAETGILDTRQEISCAGLTESERQKIPACQQLAMSRAQPWMARLVSKLREDAGVDSETVKRIYSRQTNTLDGWAPTKVDGVEVFDYFVALDRLAFTTLKTSVEALCERLLDTTSEQAIYDSVNQVIVAAGGDQKLESGMTFQEFFSKLLFIPAVALKTNFMKQTPKDLFAKLQDQNVAVADKTEIQKKICRFSHELAAMRSDAKVISADWDGSKKRWQTTKESEFVWVVRPEFGLELYYLPLNYFP